MASSINNQNAVVTASVIHARLAVLLEEARRALRGECGFDSENIRRLPEPITEMDPLVARAQDLCRLQTEIAAPLDLYKSQLSELQTTLTQIRVMPVARQASLLAGRSQVQAVTHWMPAFQATR